MKTVVAARTIIDQLLNFGVNAPIEGCEYDYIDNTGVYYYSGMLSVGNGEYIQPIETSSKEIAENLFVTYYSWKSEYAKEEATQSFNNQYAAAVKLLGKSDDKADAGTKYAALTAANEELKAAGEDQAKIDVANISIAKAKDAIKEQNKVIADLKEMTELIASMSGADVAAYDKAIEALKTNETVLAYVAACDAYDDAYEAYEVADANYSALFNLANNYGVDAKAEIRTLEANNATLNKEIADLDSTYGVLDREQQIARLEVSVANLTAQIDAIQKCMDVIMDQINALIAE